ncbi:MAG: c-type cytochrome [Magnetococcales bacterium]|nr:c-type cytochrome [Magnetococcales bacterium]
MARSPSAIVIWAVLAFVVGIMGLDWTQQLVFALWQGGSHQQRSGEPVRLVRQCVACHDLSSQQRTNRIGPPLWRIHNRLAARAIGYRYSSSWQSRVSDCLFWTSDNLNRFLMAPEQWMPGGRMVHVGVAHASDRAELVAWLQQLREEESPSVLTLAAMVNDPADPYVGQPIGAIGEQWLVQGAREAEKCMACHDLTPARRTVVGPPLWDIVDKPAGQARGFCYSVAFQKKIMVQPLVWNEQNLYLFLRSPATMIPETRMLFDGVGDHARRAGLVAYLRSLR